METKPQSQITSAFLWLATIIGFVVDTVALIGLFSIFKLGDTHITGVSTSEIPKINIANIALKWKDVSLVIILYLLFAFFALIRFKHYRLKEVVKEKKTKKVLDSDDPIDSPNSGICLNAIFFLVFLWVMVFIYPTSTLWNSFYFIVIGWLFSIIYYLIAIHCIKKEYSFPWSALIGIGISIFLVVPMLAFVFALLFNLSFLSTLGSLLLTSITSVGYSIIQFFAWIYSYIGIGWVTEKFYDIQT